jgi:hypothetical protein
MKLGIGLILLTALCVAAPAPAQDSLSGGSTYWTIAVAGGMNLPLGSWKDHPYAAGVRQFGPAWSAGAEIVLQSGNTGFGLVGIYAPLATDEWVDHARSRGDVIAASGSMAMVLLALRPRIVSVDDNAVTLHLAGGVLFLRGNETFHGVTYDYTFLPRIAGVVGGGLEYERTLNERAAVFGRAFFCVSLASGEYGGGHTQTPQLLPLLVGVRFRL